MTSIEKQENTTTALSIADDQTEFNENQVSVLNQLGVSNANRGDLAVFFHQVKRTGLDPFAKQIYMIARQGKQTIQTGIDGFRLIARRATDRSGGSLGYEDTLWCGPDGQWVDVWLSNQPPMAAKVTVIRNGERFPATALLSEYVGLKRDGNPNQMWGSKPALMLAKCAEALSLRKAFPQDLSGIYTSDEMQQADNQNGGVQQSAQARPQSVPEQAREYWNGGNAEKRDRKQWVAAFTQQLLNAESAQDMDKLIQLGTYVEKHSDGELVRMAQTTLNRMRANAPQSEDQVVEGEVVPEQAAA